MSADHHLPCLRAQRNKVREMACVINNKMISGTHFVESLTITFMARTGEREVIGRVIAAMAASRSADREASNDPALGSVLVARELAAEEVLSL